MAQYKAEVLAQYKAEVLAQYKAEVLAQYDSWPKGSPERGAIQREKL